MDTPTKVFVAAAVKGTIVADAAYVSVFAFRLGYFLFEVALVGAVLTWAITAGNRPARAKRIVGVVALLSYLVAGSVLLWI